MIKKIIGCLAICGLFLSFKLPSAFADSTFVTPEFEARIVELFSTDRCPEVLKMVKPEHFEKLRPNLIAIVASCEPLTNASFAESLFSDAETKDPTGDLVWVLHARYRSRRNLKEAEPLWQKVLMYARNPFLRRMAEEYFKGNIDEDLSLNLQDKITFYGSFQAGLSHESNPQNWASLTQTDYPAEKWALNDSANLSAQRWFHFGSIAGNYALNDNHYLGARLANYLENDFEMPIALRVGANQDLVFKPFGMYANRGGKKDQTNVGLGVSGVSYEREYKQFVQGSIYSDAIFNDSLHDEEGTHYRFEYSWEFFPPRWFFRTLFFMEHVATDKDHRGVDNTITTSHTDFGLKLKGQYDFGWATVGFTPEFVSRLNSSSSAYISPISGQWISERRKDNQLVLTGSLAVPIVPYLQLYMWYSWNRVFSNVGPEDYTNKNKLDQTIGMALRTYWSSY